MKSPEEMADEHIATTRRYFLRLAAGGAAGLLAGGIRADDRKGRDALAEAISKLTYLTSDEQFRYVGRIQPKVSAMSEAERAEAGITRDTWQLDVLPDPESEARALNPMTKADGTALTFKKLMEIAETKAVRYLKVMTCNNIAEPLGMGLWEGVPLREIIWLLEPDPKVRRVHYHGYHRDDPKWLFRSSLSINRVFEDPPGGQPVLLCYKLNGNWLEPDRGAPVRMLVPDAYGFKSVKWLRQVMVTTSHLNNDTYAENGNDVESRMKTYARILNWREEMESGAAIPLTGIAQSGEAGLSKVQYWLKPADQEWPAEDEYFAEAPWVDAEILPPPERNWGGGYGEGKLPPIRHQIGKDGKPLKWPLPNTIVHYAALLTDVPNGKYELRVRSVDGNGVPQPLPRSFQKSGKNAIQVEPLVVGG